MNKLNNSDLIDATLQWVIGVLFQQCMSGQPLHGYFHGDDGKFEYTRFHNYALQTHSAVYLYITGRKMLDEFTSDTESSLAIKAKYIFGWYGPDNT